MPKISLEEMLDASVHYGHQTRRWNPKMKPFIFKEHNGIYILDLEKTLPLLVKACVFLAKTVAEGGNILFVGTKKQAQAVVQAEAERCKMFYVTHRWLGGMLTNFKTIRSGIDRLKKIETMSTDGTMEQLLKKERVRLGKEKGKLEKIFSGIKEMSRLPSAIFLIDPKHEHIAVEEAIRLHIPIVALIDTNCDPDPINHLIPGNDDASRSITLITKWIADSCLEGLSRREQLMAAQSDKDESSQDDSKTKESTDEKLVVTRRKPRRRVQETDEEGVDNSAAHDTALI